MDKASKNAREAEDRRDFHRLQMKEMAARKQSSYNDDKETVAKNMELLKVVCARVCRPCTRLFFTHLFSLVSVTLFTHSVLL